MPCRAAMSATRNASAMISHRSSTSVSSEPLLPAQTRMVGAPRAAALVITASNVPGGFVPSR